jgi:hypothetical protein
MPHRKGVMQPVYRFTLYVCASHGTQLKCPLESETDMYGGARDVRWANSGRLSSSGNIYTHPRFRMPSLAQVNAACEFFFDILPYL